MKVFISGLSQFDFLAYFGEHVELELEWCEPARFEDTLESCIRSTEQQRAVWLYRAPWLLAGSRLSAEQDAESILDAWLAQQRTVLKSRRAIGDLLLLVNVDRVSAPELLAKLGVVSSDEALLPPVIGESVSSALLAKIFEWVAPSFWEIFESLESAAWLSQGEPIFRSNLRAPDNSSLFELLNVLQAGLKFPILEAMLAAGQDSVVRLQQDLEMSVKSQADRDELLKENESLLSQLHQVQEGLESVLLANEENSAGAEQERMALIAEKEARASELAKTRELLEGSEARCAELLQALVQSGNLLREQMAELERERVALAEKETMLAAAQEAMASELGQSRELLKSTEVRCAELQQALVQQVNAQVHNEALVKENELLLLQLHQVQEDLERCCFAHPSLLGASDEETSSISVAGEVVIEPFKTVVEKIKEQSRVLALLSAPVIRYVKHTKSEKKLRLQMIFIEQSGFFDRKWYLKMYPDVLELKIDPIKHYLKFGWEERRDPSGRFSTSYYLNTYQDVENSGVNPLIHYIKFGAAEGRQPRAPWS